MNKSNLEKINAKMNWYSDKFVALVDKTTEETIIDLEFDRTDGVYIYRKRNGNIWYPDIDAVLKAYPDSYSRTF
jgi:hypothetical protein